MKSITAKKPRKPASEALWAIRREEILDAAARLFARHGYPETDTQLLADELGVGKGTLYRYFASKEELFFAAVDRAMEAIVAKARAGDWSGAETDGYAFRKQHPFVKEGQ